MAIQEGYRYTKTIVEWDKFAKDTCNQYRFVSQKRYKGKPESGLAAGATVTLQIVQDNSAPVIDKETGRPKENNVLETFNATIIGVNYPLPLSKGDFVALDGFLVEKSFYIDFDFILRFTTIKKLQPAQPQGQRQGGRA